MTDRCTAKEYAERYGFTEQAIIHRIKSGILTGEQTNDEWVVITTAPKRNQAIVESEHPGASSRKPVSSAKASPVIAVRFKSKVFLVILISVVIWGIVAEILVAMVFSGGFPIGIVSKLILLTLVAVRHKWTRIAIQIGMGASVVHGITGLITFLFETPTDIIIAFLAFVDFSFGIVVGTLFLLFTHKYVELIRKQDESV